MSPPKLVVISHIFNEEYLLPFWLEYHSSVFDHGIIIDYCSTDDSLAIVRQWCPTWTVVRTRNVNPDGSPNFVSNLIDREVQEYESWCEATLGPGCLKIALNITEFLVINQDRSALTSSVPICYHVPVYNVSSGKCDFYPKNGPEFFDNIRLIGGMPDYRKYRYMHSAPRLNYVPGRHSHTTKGLRAVNGGTQLFILYVKEYCLNPAMIRRRIQIQRNIPQADIGGRRGIQHMTTEPRIVDEFGQTVAKMTPIVDRSVFEKISRSLAQNGVLYSELVHVSRWGPNRVLLHEDINIMPLSHVDGYVIVELGGDRVASEMGRLMSELVGSVIGRPFGPADLESYHKVVSDEEHTRIINAMPWKADTVSELPEILEKVVSETVGHRVRIFNGDLWIRICRPSSRWPSDNNPYHTDVKLDFYRNTVNIYVPVAGSNDKSSLTICPGSHLWSEDETAMTVGGAVFKHLCPSVKRYSVDAVVRSKRPVGMIRPDPGPGQMMVFSPYLIHGGASNENADVTRFSLEVRFILDVEASDLQEAQFRSFLESRKWR